MRSIGNVGSRSAPERLWKASEKIALPRNHSWEHLQAMKDVRNQGGCGSCWAFAATTVLRAHAEIYQQDRTFSVQQVLACTPNPQKCGGAGGCSGATAELGIDYVLKHGVMTEEEFPYHGVTGTCPSVQPSLLVKNNGLQVGIPGPMQSTEIQGLMGWDKLPENKEEPLMRALVEWGPVAVSVSADLWEFYGSGIFTGCPKGAVIDHAVTLIGYGDDVKKYWNVQNSWGADWGENGRIRIERTEDDQQAQCGWDRQPELGNGCVGGPSKVRVCGMCGMLYDSVVPHFVGSSTMAKEMLSRRQQILLLSKIGTLRP